MQSNLKKLLESLEQNKLDALIVSHPANVSYLCGFDTREAALLITKSESFFITDFRYVEESKASLTDKNFKIIQVLKDTALNLMLEQIKELRLKNIGFEAKKISFSGYKFLEENRTPYLKLIPTYDLVEQLRIVKSEFEIRKIKFAISKTIKIFKDLKEVIRPGISEIEVSAEIEKLIRLASARPPAFEPIVAAGKTSSKPHALSTKNKITKSSPVLVDIGLELDGYKSDLTRVFFLSRINAKIKKIYDIVRLAQEKAINAIRPGVNASLIDKISRDIIVNKGFGKFFGHSLGHGVGLEVHENPSLNPKSQAILKEGMILTVEPAIYLPGQFGIRLEDMILVTKTKCEVLSGSLSK